MNSILRIRSPFYRRLAGGGNNGLVSLYLKEDLPYRINLQSNQAVIISHTQVPESSGLDNLLNNISTNILTAKYVSLTANTDPTQFDGYPYKLDLQYDNTNYSLYGGDCTGYIEYEVSPSSYSILKTIPNENVVIVNESVPYDMDQGINEVTNLVTGSTFPEQYLRAMFVKRTDNNTIFANLLKALNLPVSVDEMKKYTRSDLGVLTQTSGLEYDTIIGGTKYTWSKYEETGSTVPNLVVHPTTGWTGEYYKTALQSIGSYEFTPNNKAIQPIQNDLYLILEIPNSSYGEIIDGKTVKLEIPYFKGGTASTDVEEKLGVYDYSVVTGETLVAYGTYNKNNLNTTNLDRVLSEIDKSVKDIGIKPDLTNLTYESNIVLLFSDTIKTPVNAAFDSWENGYTDLIDGTRVFNPLAQEKSLYDYHGDECVGFIALDKGFVVITHPKIVDSYFINIFGGEISISNDNNIFTSSKNYNINNVSSTSTERSGDYGTVQTDPTKLITTQNSLDEYLWDSTQFVLKTTDDDLNCSVKYISYNTEKTLNIVCLASSDEFYKSTNDTAKEMLDLEPSADFADLKSTSLDLHPAIITQLGIHDAEGNLLAICKPSQPVKKYWYDVVSFNIRIRL